MQAILLSREEVARRAKQLYESRIRQEVEGLILIVRIVLASKAPVSLS